MPTTISTTQIPSFSSSVPSLLSSILARNPAILTGPTYLNSSSSSNICVGKRLDVSADGLLATAVLSCAIGLVSWVLFAIIRPRFRSIYALREWFVHPALRPRPLPSSFLAFLNPQIPLFPSLPTDFSGAMRSDAEDARLFPSDEQLSQRFLWLAFVIASGWSFISLCGALPVYLVNISCSLTNSTGFYGGTAPLLLELSILRLLRVFDTGLVSAENIDTHIQGTAGDPLHARIRVIVITVLALAGGLFPAVYLVLREFNKLLKYRMRWTEVKCHGNELGWLSASRAPGFVGWGEKQMKQFIISLGLTSSLDATEQSNGIRSARRRGGSRRRRLQERALNYTEQADLGVDIQMLFSIGDTRRLAELIFERDGYLENLEIAESKYIKSFRITTPDPSVLDFELNVPPPNPDRPYISPPQPLGHRRRPRGRRAINRALASSSLAPISFVAPSQYYKLRNLQGLHEDLTDPRSNEKEREMPPRRRPEPSFSDAFNSRIVGSRFFEVNRNSIINGHIPIGSPLSVDETGQLAPSRDDHLDTIPDPRLYGPNYVPDTDSWDGRIAQQLGLQPRESYAGVSAETDDNADNGWVDIARTAPADFGVDYYQIPATQETGAGPSSHASGAAALLAPTHRRPRIHKPQPPIPQPESRRETFPLRQKEAPESIPPPHMRLQPVQPFVRPLDGVSFNELGKVYANITLWRSKLKAINSEIEDLQRECYNDIADGARIKGWLMVGRGLDYIPGIELVEGRAKEDIRWDVLQNEPVPIDTAVVWALIGVVIVLLAAALTAATGLSLATAPDVAHYLPFLASLLKADPLASGIATVLAPAFAIIVFMIIALTVVYWAANVYGYISISAGQFFVLKFTFLSSIMTTIWLVVIGGLLYSLQAFSVNETDAMSVADGSISSSVLMLAIVTSFVVISPGLLLLQPKHALQTTHAQRDAVTPRQRFRALYPLTYEPSFSLGACIFASVIGSTFWLIFPLIGPVVMALLFLTLIAHRYLVGYVYARTHSQTGGLLQLWLVKRLGTILSLQPILLGLIFLSRKLWIEGSILLAIAISVALFIEIYAHQKTRRRPRSSLSAITQDSLNRFEGTATDVLNRTYLDGQETTGDTSGRGTRMRESMASVLDMMSITLAVSPAQFQGAVPLRTETIDDLTATERAARTHPDAPPHLPPLLFTGHVDDMAGVLYAPELIAPPPMIWLPNDSAGVARSEAADLRKYHDLHATIDVCEDTNRLRRALSSGRR
ncbi:hypothetical protein F5887DRAFT_1178097 [Amanita rubescens]|nr:hypothetical protein F5887DRAFT_1178097 [Amanita rubescens]